MKALIFDTETSGMVEFNKPATDECQPELIQLAMTLVDVTDGWRQLCSFSSLVDPGRKYQMHPDAQNRHGIPVERIIDEGMDARTATEVFLSCYHMADLFIGHNVAFDRRIMETALHRSLDTIEWKLKKPKICTMHSSTKVVGALHKDGRRGKWPTLAEAYRHFTGRNLEGAHDALIDLLACQEVCKALVEGGHITIEEVLLSGG